MNRLKYIIVVLICLISISCMKEKREATYTSQESKIDQYISSKRPVRGENGTDSLRGEYYGGASRLILEEGDGEELQPGGMVSFYYAGYTFTNNKAISNLFTTNHEATATAAGWDLTDADYELLTIELNSADLMTGLKDGLKGVKSGEHCEILFSGKYGFGKKPIGIVSANSALLFEIWVEAVSNE